MADGFHLSLDPGSLATLVRLEGFAALLNPEVTIALSEAGALLVTAAQANTWTAFQNPTGQLSSSIGFWVVSPEEVEITVGVPYARRQEFGGGGFQDSLGRAMTNPAEPYLQPALDDNQEAVRDLIRNGVQTALDAL